MPLVSLDAALATYIPNFKVRVQASAREKVTVRMEFDRYAWRAVTEQRSDDFGLLKIPKLDCAALVACDDNL